MPKPNLEQAALASFFGIRPVDASPQAPQVRTRAEAVTALQGSYQYWIENEIHTKPFAASLCVVSALEGIASMAGRSKKAGISFLPLCIQTATGKFFCRAATLHAYADSLLAAVKEE